MDIFACNLIYLLILIKINRPYDGRDFLGLFKREFFLHAWKILIFHMPKFMLAWNYFIEYLVSLKRKIAMLKISKRN